MELYIREAKRTDLKILKKFEQDVIQFERPFAPNLKEDPISYYDLFDLMQRDDAQVLVGVADGRVVASGYALIKNSKPYFKEAKHAYLGFMYVEPEYRGKNINGEIVSRLLDWIKRKNLVEIQLEVYAENQSAIKAYAKAGFKPDLLKMRLNLDDIEG
jgi:RimJ/RimL family protein N-acetyltransferase